MNPSLNTPKVHLPRWQLVMITAITLVYLICELSFNARLLDLVGSIATTKQIHSMERFGRALTSIAVALLVLQLALSVLARRQPAGKRLSPAGAIVATGLLCLSAATGTWYSVQTFIETQVSRSSSTFRQTALQAQLYQQGLINGSQILEGIPQDKNGGQTLSWRSPSGKAFLAMLPLLLSGVERYHALIRDGAEQNLRDSLSAREGGVRGFYTAWLNARQKIRLEYDAYYNDRLDLSDVIKKNQKNAWERYETELARHHMTPDSVPFYFAGRVRKMVQRQGVPVYNRWRPSDQASFNAAVELNVRRQYLSKRTVSFNGVTIPKRLGWETFFELKVVQDPLHKSMHIPASIRIKAKYPLNDSLRTFATEVQIPHLNLLVKEQLPQLLAPEQTYQNGGLNEERGKDAARAVLVPPIALMLSLCGALTHLTKLLYLLVVQVSPVLIRKWPSRITGVLNRHPLLFPSGITCALILMFSSMDNSITSSSMYEGFRQTLEGEPVNVTGEPLLLSAGALLKVVQTVSIGQSYTWPFNNMLRKTLLGGFNFGFTPPVAPQKMNIIVMTKAGHVLSASNK